MFDCNCAFYFKNKTGQGTCHKYTTNVSCKIKNGMLQILIANWQVCDKNSSSGGGHMYRMAIKFHAKIAMHMLLKNVTKTQNGYHVFIEI